jgi:hypothetical protein
MPRCLRCQREIAVTTHAGETYSVDGFCLHTGKTKRVQTTGDKGEKIDYLQVSEPIDAFLCVDCFARPEIQDVWLSTFPDRDQTDALKR